MAGLEEYLLFLAKGLTVVALVVAAVGMILNSLRWERPPGIDGGQLTARPLNRHYHQLDQSVLAATEGQRAARRYARKAARARRRRDDPERPRVYVLDFVGDMRASRAQTLREEVTAILSMARAERDAVLLRLDSQGGTVPGYGLAASQLARLREAGIPLTVSIDRVAASGGYLMACVADRIVAAPFAVVGSIGVIGALPNFNRFLRRHDIDFEQHTAGEWKRTLSLFGENTDEAREKFRQDLESVHRHFKGFIQRYRPALDLDQVATGEYWLAEEALGLGLVDELGTSDDWLLRRRDDHRLVQLRYRHREPFGQRWLKAAQGALGSRLQRLR
ncbi:protease SohB [Alkalilimnicola ehrlichii MLHE-1]|uniref:Inner membrane peptidase n=1 Tax=Alkalilimnicola ehrlichii (strain ATCC BAA-1101 / DSM 17681 / MLHE-1) TaxID=187272 RepID=Q0ABV0_ALKEH|nr:protease SohB [Alkalilimnicola ehrlichii]ABI55687.1 inner membrane peptidase [Alkalilimnicola ehrlichii MLHE-1]